MDLSEYYQNWKGSEPVMPNVLPLSPNAMFADVKPMSPGIRVFHFFIKGKTSLNLSLQRNRKIRPTDSVATVNLIRGINPLKKVQLLRQI